MVASNFSDKCSRSTLAPSSSSTPGVYLRLSERVQFNAALEGRICEAQMTVTVHAICRYISSPFKRRAENHFLRARSLLLATLCCKLKPLAQSHDLFMKALFLRSHTRPRCAIHVVHVC
jgi:hypothetical protein